jgi:ribonuclease P protein component
MAAGDQSFPPSARLTKRPEFLAVQRRGRRLESAHFRFLWTPNGRARCRLGITVTRRVAGAVGRNRIKRLVREAFRAAGELRPAGVDLVAVAKPGARRLGQAEVRAELAWALERIGRTPG